MALTQAIVLMKSRVDTLLGPNAFGMEGLHSALEGEDSLHHVSALFNLIKTCPMQFYVVYSEFGSKPLCQSVLIVCMPTQS